MTTTALAWSADGQLLAAAAADRVVLIEVPAARLTATYDLPAGGVLCWLDGHQLFTSDFWGRAAAVVDHQRSELRHFTATPAVIRAVLPEQRMVLSVRGRVAWQWSLDDGRPRRTMLHLPDGRYAVIQPDGRFQGSPGVEQELRYVVQHDRGQETLEPAEFIRRDGRSLRRAAK